MLRQSRSQGLAGALVLLATLAVGAGTMSGLGGPQEQPTPTEVPSGPVDGHFRVTVGVTATLVNVVAVDDAGHAVTDLKAEELEVLEDGSPARVLALEPGVERARPATGGRVPAPSPESLEVTPWRVVVYACTELAGRFQLPHLFHRAASEAGRLTSLGPVDVVLADPDPWLVIEGARRAEDLARTLETMAGRKFGQTTLERIRRRFIHDLEPGAGLAPPEGNISSELPVTSTSLAMTATRARAAAREETNLVRSHLDKLVAWIQSQPPTKRGLLVWMTGGFDVRPADFYLQYVAQLDRNLVETMRHQEFGARTLEPDVQRMIEVALAYGWTIMPLNSAAPEAFLFGPDVGGTSKVQHFNGVSANSIDAEEHDFAMMAPTYPLRLAAEATGGELVMYEDEVAGALERARSAYLLSYQVDRLPDGRLHHLEVRSRRPGVTVRSQPVVVAGTTAGSAAERGLMLLAGARGRGDLAVRARLVNVGKAGHNGRLGRVEIVADLSLARVALPRSAAGKLRITLVVQLENEAPFIHHQELPFPDSDPWGQASEIRLPPEARRMAVVVEELATGLWGSAEVEVPRR